MIGFVQFESLDCLIGGEGLLPWQATSPYQHGFNQQSKEPLVRILILIPHPRSCSPPFLRHRLETYSCHSIKDIERDTLNQLNPGSLCPTKIDQTSFNHHYPDLGGCHIDFSSSSSWPHPFRWWQCDMYIVERGYRRAPLQKDNWR